MPRSVEVEGCGVKAHSFINRNRTGAGAVSSGTRRDPFSGQSIRMSEKELRAGRFTDGATKFVFTDQRPEVHFLAVNETEVDDAIASILASLIGRRYAKRPVPETRQET